MRYFFLFVLLFYCHLVNSQVSIEKKWYLGLNIGLEAHDKRLFGYGSKSQLLKTQQEYFGTYTFGISVAHKYKLSQQFKLKIGLGVGSELHTFRRPFDHKYLRNHGSDILLFTDRYYKFLMQSPASVDYILNTKWSVNATVLTSISFLTIADNSKINLNKDNSWWRIDFHSIELVPGLTYALPNSLISLGYRIFQVKKIDKIIFNNILRDMRNDESIEFYNPTKIVLSLSVGLGCKIIK